MRSILLLIFSCFSSIESFTQPVQLIKNKNLSNPFEKIQIHRLFNKNALNINQKPQQSLLFGTKRITDENNLTAGWTKVIFLVRTKIATIRKFLLFVMTSTFIFLSTTSSTMVTPCHAYPKTAIQKIHSNSESLQLCSTSRSASTYLEKQIQNYVEKHMYDEDTYDSFESLYRESYGDKLSNQNEILNYMLPSKPTDAAASKLNIFKLPSMLISKIGSLGENYLGMDAKLGRTFAAAIVVGATPIMMFYTLLSAGGFLRKVLMKQETRRYGGVSDLTADEKEEDDLDLDDEDDDDNDETGEDSKD